MNPLIVGHGPSLTGANKGFEIDRHTVIRMKRFTRFHEPVDYGLKTDYLCASTEAAPQMLGQTDPTEYWLYPKKGEYDHSVKTLFKDKPYVIPLEETKIWNRKFQKLVGYEGGTKGRNISTGLAAIVICAWRLKPEKIVLAGFDTLLDPSIEYYSVFNPGTVHDVMHFWKQENSMLPEIEDHYNVELVPL
jgi:hypothetical protein